MRTPIMLIAVLCLAGVAWGQQPGPAPKPGPEHQKLALWVGDWQYEGQAKESPLGPAGKFSGQMTARPILGGFFVEFRGHETSPLGDIDWVETYGYDPVREKYTWTGFTSDGSGSTGTYTLDGATISYAGTMTAAGKQYRIRGTTVFAPDFMSTVDKQEISTDGKTWAAFSERKFTKVKAAPAHGTNTQAEQDMPTRMNKEMARRWLIGLWDEMNFNLLTEMATPDYTYRGPDTGPDGLGAAACIELVKATNGAFPDKHNTIEGQVAEGDRVVTWGTTRGTQQGALGEIPASGKSIAVPWMMITEFRGGKIARDREFYDRLGLMQQLGMAPPVN
jgi:steroid delta-isomerase-like uncharacterized protein